jgi:hypothetical protein
MNVPTIQLQRSIERQNVQFIDLAKAVEKELGKEETVEVIKEWATEFNLERGRKQAERSPDRSLKTYTRMFANPKDWEGLLNMELVEDLDTAFELNVFECFPAANFIKSDASDFGYVAVFCGEKSWLAGFNPKIKMVRDKTLMQGKLFCNHRCIWTE